MNHSSGSGSEIRQNAVFELTELHRQPLVWSSQSWRWVGAIAVIVQMGTARLRALM